MAAFDEPDAEDGISVIADELHSIEKISPYGRKGFGELLRVTAGRKARTRRFFFRMISFPQTSGSSSLQMKRNASSNVERSRLGFLNLK